MADPQTAVITQLRNIQSRTGKTIEQLHAAVRSSGLVKHGERRSWLMEQFKLGYGDANTVVHFLDKPLPSLDGGAPPAPDGSGQNMAHLCLTSASRDAGTLLSHLARHGVSTSGVAVRYGADGFGPSVYVKDPDGNTIELKLSAKA